MSEAARAKGDLESWVGWLQAAVAAAGDADTAARLRRLAAEAVVTHDEAALRYGRLTWRWHGGGGARPGEADQLPTLMRIEPFNATLAATRRATVRRWRRRHEEFLARYSTLQYSAVQYSTVPRQVPDVPQPTAARGGGHLGQGGLQGEDGRAVPAGGYHLNKDCVYLTLTPTIKVPGSAYIVASSSLTCRHLSRGQEPHLRLGPAKLEQLSLEPGVFLLHSFASKEECDQLRARGRGRMKAITNVV